MKVKILGAHNVTSRGTGCSSYLIDGKLAVDAGSISANLTLPQMGRLKAVLLTHQHYDHVRDLPGLGMALTMRRKSVTVCATQAVYDVLKAHLMNNIVYPDFFARPEKKPTLVYRPVTAGETFETAGYRITPAAMKHAVPTTGYAVTSGDGRQVFITSDTGPGLAEAWKLIEPHLLIIELTMASRHQKAAERTGHLTPATLTQELESFRSVKGYLPRVALMHLNPPDEARVREEALTAGKRLGVKFTFCREGMTLTV